MTSLWSHMVEKGVPHDWDILWLGHMGDSVLSDDIEAFQYNDVTVPVTSDSSPEFNDQHMFPDQSRTVHRSDFPLCTFGYAVSYQGAQKILFRMEQNLDSHYDTDLANHCRTGLHCLSVTPPLFHEYDKQNRGSSDTSDGGARDNNMKIYKVRPGWRDIRHI
ncbi:hypothetical protein BDZ85DRAFT_270893 [Elsinoe ampelina]|uniref:Uncharacterized protein n=1 Tax=Elsinoe ampelina TaxID=302913 RepID=A0A6A6FXU6_9PEZI|nr:hypothetical protein BDZ85DRAFT_270893 [Elsinoe ampelina]